MTYAPSRLPNALMRLILLAVFLSSTPTAATAGCADSFTIGDTSYTVPDKWCAHRLDSAQIADQTKLARLLDKFTFEDYRIYVLPETKAAFEQMAVKAKQDSVILTVDSGYRSASFQRRIIETRLNEGGDIRSVLQMVAPPGYSQHETGLALDLVPSEAAFASTNKYRWLQEHAKEFGFVESYPENNPDSLDWESWHWLYVDSLRTNVGE